MFWSKIAFVYDLFENVYNKKVYRNTGRYVAAEINADDHVLECACGTGAISVHIAPVCKSLTATDMADGMLRQTSKKTRKFKNVKVRRADMTSLKCKDGYFDKVVAGNVIHLLDDPEASVRELVRVCRPGGKIIIPTYINFTREGRTSLAVKFIHAIGADFKRQFDLDSYKKFFSDAGYKNVSFHVVEGRMPCAVAVITK